MKTYPITDKRNQAFYPVIACLLICLALFILSIVSENVGPAGVGAMSFFPVDPSCLCRHCLPLFSAYTI